MEAGRGALKPQTDSSSRMGGNGERMAQTTAHRQIVVAKNYDELCAGVVQKILGLSLEAIKERGRCTMALSGGSTPRGVYSLMADSIYADKFDWNNILFFLGDERWVPLNDSRSNYRMIAEALGANVKIPHSHLYHVKTDTANVQTSAELYEQQLISSFGLKPDELPRFDIALLGLGEDGHTASLFPGNSAVDETKRLVVPVEAEGIAEKRVTLTLPVINNSRNILFLVSGSGKASTLKKILEDHEQLPAGKVNPRQGALLWYADESAAGLLHSHSA